MRRNLPITQREYPFAESETLLSATDVKGRILYANRAFLRVAGYSKDQLYGQPHNIVRHPDMPAEAFADMWQTVRSGATWSALVKNRRSDGDHYWVRANVTPIRDHDGIVGFLSVRTKAEPHLIDVLEPLYQAWSQGTLKGACMRQGRLVGAHWSRWLDGVRHKRSTGGRLAVGLALMVVLALLAPLAQQASWDGPWLLMVMLSSVLIWWWWHMSILEPVRQVLAQARQVASGQRPVNNMRDRGDELGALMQAIEQAGLNLVALGGDMEEQVRELREAVDAMQSGNLDLYGCAGQSTEQLEQTSQALEELGQTIAANRDAVKSLSSLSEDAHRATQRGKTMMSKTGETMREISESGQRVAEISSMIDSIAFQTNILALNAAVEAARAGEHGRGFAVVASEVRALSRQSADAAREIKDLIGATHRQIMAGVEVVAQAGEAMGEILNMVGEVADLTKSFDGATDQQHLGVNRVRESVYKLDELARRNGELAEEGAAATMSLHELATQLSEASSVYRLCSKAARQGKVQDAEANVDPS